MTHSKFQKRGRSLYLIWNPRAKKFINVCKICGYRGYSPAIEAEDFCNDPANRAIRASLMETLQCLPLDGFGRCEMCARAQDENDG